RMNSLISRTNSKHGWTNSGPLRKLVHPLGHPGRSAPVPGARLAKMSSQKLPSLGIKRLEAIHYYVHDLERSRRFYTGLMDFAEVGGSSDTLTASGRQKSVMFQAGDCRVLCSAPVGEGGRAWRYLRKHPDGVGTLIFEVEDIERTFALLEERGGTPIDDV